MTIAILVIIQYLGVCPIPSPTVVVGVILAEVTNRT